MIKSILGGKSKNLCDLAYLLTLPLDKTLEGYGYLRVLINAKPNTTYTFSRENANQIDIGTTYLAISAYDDYQHNHWLNHEVSLSSCNKSVTLTTNSDGKLWIMFSGDVYYKYWQKNLNPFGYIQLELGSTATEYVPHELTSYKSIMKVSDGHFVTSFDERMPCKTKNLFSSSTEVGTLEGGIGGPTVARTFEENKWYVGLTCNNYYNPGMIKEYSIKSGLIYFKRDDINSNGYGLARAIKCEPSTTYTVSLEPIYVEEYYAFNIGYFDKNGNLVSTDYTPGMTKTITTPNNCSWIVFVLNFYDKYTSGKGKVYVCDLQLEKGTTATDYVPYGYV